MIVAKRPGCCISRAMKSYRTALGIAALLLMMDRPSLAADPAEILIRQGVELRRSGKDGQALEKFKQAYATSHSPRSAAQLGLCEQSLQKWLDAEGHLTEALEAPSDPWVNRNLDALKKAKKDTDSHLAKLAVTGRPAGAAVTVNGHSEGILPLPSNVSVLPGEVVVSVSASGYETKEQRLTVAAAQLAEVKMDLSESKPAQPAQFAAVPVGGPEDTNLSASMPTAPHVNEPTPFYKSPWLYVALGAVALVAVGAIVLSGSESYPTVDATREVPKP